MSDDLESRLNKASTPASLEQLSAQGIKRVRVVTKGMLNAMVKEAIDRVLAERKETLSLPEVARVGALVEQDMAKDALTQLNDKMDGLKELLNGLAGAGRISRAEADALVTQTQASLAKVMGGMEIESNLDQVAGRQVETDGVTDSLARLKSMGGGS